MTLSTEWQERHAMAMRMPRAQERPIVAMLKGWLAYAQDHRARFDSPIGEDGVLGPEWEAIGDALRGLLNGDCGRLDCGTLDGLILNTMRENGVDVSRK